MKTITLKNIEMPDLGISCLNEKWEHRYYKVEVVVKTDDRERLKNFGVKEFCLLSTSEYCFMFCFHEQPKIYNTKGERIFVNANGNIKADVDICLFNNGKTKRVDIHFIEFIGTIKK